MNQSLVKEHVLIEAILSFFIELREMRFGIQVTEERADLFHSDFPAKFVSHLAEVKERDEERFVQRSVADVGMTEHEVEFPHLPPVEFTPEPQKAMDAIQLGCVQILNDLLVGIARC